MKIKILTIAVLILLILSACSGSTNEEVPSISGQVESVAEQAESMSADGSEAQPAEGHADIDIQEVQLSTQMRLILGSLALDQADLNFSAEQANTLLPLWKVLKNLIGSDTSAAAEIEALLNQIQSVLSEEQLAWVETYNPSQDDYQAILAEFVPEDVLNSGSLMTDEEREERRATAIAENGGTVPQELQGSGGGRGMGGGSGVPRSVTGETPGDGTGESQGNGYGAGQINIYLIDGLIAELEAIAAP